MTTKLQNFLFLAAMLVYNAANAADPFSKATDRAQDILDFLTGKFAITVVAIVISIAGFALMQGKINKATGWSIIGGSVLIAAAAQIASWVMG